MASEGMSTWLQGLSDVRLTELVMIRLGRVTRIPSTFDELAARLSQGQSCDEAARRLDRTAVQVVAVLAESGGRSSVRDLATLLDSPDAQVRAALVRAQTLGLAWSLDEGGVWRTPSGLAPCADHLLRRGLSYSQLLPELPFAALVALTRTYALGGVRSAWHATQSLTQAMPRLVGALLAQRPDAVAALRGLLAAGEPVEDELSGWLVEHGLVLQVGDGWLVPAEVDAAVRGDCVVLQVERPPDREGLTQASPPVAAVTALLTVAQALLQALTVAPARSLASGGLGIKELRRLARATQLELERVVVLLQVLAAAGLVGTGLRAGSVTAAGRRWWRLPEELAYVRLVGPQLHPRAVLEPAGASPAGILLGVARSGYDLPTVRVVAEAAAERGPESDASLAAYLDWSRWRPGARRDRLLGLVQPTDVLALLGLRAGGSPAPWLAPLLADEPQGPGLLPDGEDQPGALAAARLLAEHLPPPQRDVVLQADGTAVVAGRADDGLRALLDLLGARESDHTWRLAADRVRAALDAGHTGEDLLAELRDRARHDVPPVLERLVTDAVRAHGRIRLHAATTVLHLQDPVLAVELLHDRRLRPLGLTELAPGVLTSTAPPAQVASVLRAAGHAPVGEGATTGADEEEPGPARPTQRHVVPQRAWGHDPADVVAALRAGPACSPGLEPSGPPVVAGRSGLVDRLVHLTADERLLLVQAVQSGGPVELDYVDAAGERTTRVVQELAVTGHLLVGWCRLRSAERMFAPLGVVAVRTAQ